MAKVKSQKDQDQERSDMLAEAKAVGNEQEARARGIHPLSGTELDDAQELKEASGKEKERLQEELDQRAAAGLGAEVKGEDAPPPAVIEAEGTIKGMYIGAHVLFYKKDGNTAKLRPLPGIIVDMADKVSNFQPKDGAANLTVFNAHGGAVETRHNVMYSKEPAEGRWSFNPNA